MGINFQVGEQRINEFRSQVTNHFESPFPNNEDLQEIIDKLFLGTDQDIALLKNLIDSFKDSPLIHGQLLTFLMTPRDWPSISNLQLSYFEHALRDKNISKTEMMFSLDSKRKIIDSLSDEFLNRLVKSKSSLHQDVFIYLIKNGFDIKSKISNHDFIPLLIGLEKSVFLKKIIDLNLPDFDFNIKTKKGITLLSTAVMWGDEELVSKLLAHGTSIDSRDCYGHTALDYALFTGNIKIAGMLSGLSEANLIEDPRYKQMPTMMEHTKLVKNILKFIESDHNSSATANDPSINLKLPNITEGVCNGWSFYASLRAAESPQALQEFRSQIALFCQWNGDKSQLDSVAGNFKGKTQTYRELFKELSNSIYWFYQQESANSNISAFDRETQLSLISDKEVARIADFCLRDLTVDEHKMVLSAYQDVAQRSIIDIQSDSHTVCYFQDQKDFTYLDSNLLYAIPPMADYVDAVEIAHPTMQGNVTAFAYFNTEPDRLNQDAKDKAQQITRDLVQKLIFDHPTRHDQGFECISFCVYMGRINMLDILLDRVELSADQKVSLLNRSGGVSGVRYESLYCLYQKVFNEDDLKKVTSISNLENLLRSSIIYNDIAMQKDVTASLKQQLKEQDITPSTSLESLMMFNNVEATTKHKNHRPAPLIHTSPTLPSSSPKLVTNPPDLTDEKSKKVNSKFKAS